MVQVIFGVRYVSQLRRLRPALLKSLEDEVRSAFTEAGGNVSGQDYLLVADFSERALAFWLDLAIVLDRIAAALAKSAPELYGYACLACLRPPDDWPRKRVIRDLSMKANPVGIWCDLPVASALAEYADFSESADYRQLRGFRYRTPAAESEPPYWERPAVDDVLAGLLDVPATDTGFGLVGPRWTGKRQALRLWARRLLGETPILRFGFKEGSSGAAAFADAVDDRLESYVAPALSEELRRLGRETLGTVRAIRMAAVVPPALAEAFITYLTGFVTAYGRRLREAGLPPIAILENLQWADALGSTIVERVFWPLTESASWQVLVTTVNADLPLLRKKPGLRIARMDKLTTQEMAYFVHQFGDGSLALADVTALSAEMQQGGLPALYRGLIGWKRNRDGTLRLHPRVTLDYLEIAYALHLSRPLFPWQLLRQMLVLAGKPAFAYDVAVSALVRYGFLDSENDQENVLSDFAAFAERLLGEKKSRVRLLVHDCTVKALRSGDLLPSVELLRTLAALALGLEGALPPPENDWYEAIDIDLPDECGDEPSWLSETYLAAAMKSVEAAELTALANGSQALRRAAPEQRRTWFNHPIPEYFSSPTRRSNVLLDYAAETYASGGIDAAATYTKEALIGLQTHDTNRGLARAFRLLGACELAKERIAESLDYCQFAMDSAERAADWREAVIAATASAVCEYLWGNIAKAERLAQLAEERAAKRYMESWNRWSRFFKARLRFDSGRYAEALELLDALKSGVRSGGDGAEAATLAAWSARAKSYATGQPISLPIADGLMDAGLFTVEDRYRSGDYRAAVASAEKLLASPGERPYVGPERVDWSSGFAMVEDRAIGVINGERVDRRLLRTYHALALAALGAGPAAVENLRKLTKDEKTSALDPNEAFYFAAYTSSLTIIGASALDQGTALGIAFKRLQRRASRIDDIETKRSYMNLNRRNADLLADAKKHNLI